VAVFVKKVKDYVIHQKELPPKDMVKCYL